MDELGSCRAASLAASAKHAAAESGLWPGSRQHDGPSSSCACTTTKASRALDFFVGDVDRRDSDGDDDCRDSDGDDDGVGCTADGDGGGGLFTGDLERLVGISSRDDAPPGLEGLRLPPSSFASTAANPLLSDLGQSGLSKGDGDLGRGVADLSGELEWLMAARPARAFGRVWGRFSGL